jgi:DNA-binding SARP family transcriptional activator
VVDVREDGYVGRRRLFADPLDDVRALWTSCEGSPTVAGAKPFALRVVGAPSLEFWGAGGSREATHALRSKQQELLVYLAVVGEEGAHREAVNRALWPGSPPARPYNSLQNALSTLRNAMLNVSDGAVRDVVARSGPYYRINRDVVDVDYWRFRQRDTQALSLYRGDVGEGIDSLWLDLPREATRRRVIESVAELAQAGKSREMIEALGALESVRAMDPFNESVYRELIGVQLRLGCFDMARETFASLAETLGKIGQEPDARTRSLLSG